EKSCVIRGYETDSTRPCPERPQGVEGLQPLFHESKKKMGKVNFSHSASQFYFSCCFIVLIV
ncbi:MAG: hypothetical protein O6945_07855, partial [Gammaproteobacteria bacterium]|nr:hypothetical protein [Gammaproteobacteria bacterium]